jgi:hypothetical protein
MTLKRAKVSAAAAELADVVRDGGDRCSGGCIGGGADALGNRSAELGAARRLELCRRAAPEPLETTSMHATRSFVILAALAALPTTALAGDAPAEPAAEPPASTRTYNLGAKGAYLMPGTISVDANSSSEFETDGGPSALLTIDGLVAPRLSIGAFAFAASIDEATIRTLGATIKGRFPASPTIEIRPGLAFGYQKIAADGTSGITGFDMGGFVELAIRRAGSRTEWLLEAGFITQPVGGNDDVDVTFGPMFYVGAGIGFGN